MNLGALSLYDQAVVVSASLVLLTSFIMLAQARILPLIYAFAWQGRCSRSSRRSSPTCRTIRTSTSRRCSRSA